LRDQRQVFCLHQGELAAALSEIVPETVRSVVAQQSPTRFGANGLDR
jgi:hypothetical protein